MKGEKIKPMARVYPTACRLLSTSSADCASARNEKGMRRSAGSVSGWRSESQIPAMAAVANSMMKMARQSATHRRPCPRAGASVGTRMNTAIAKDMMRAIRRPSY